MLTIFHVSMIASIPRCHKCVLLRTNSELWYFSSIIVDWDSFLNHFLGLFCLNLLLLLCTTSFHLFILFQNETGMFLKKKWKLKKIYICDISQRQCVDWRVDSVGTSRSMTGYQLYKQGDRTHSSGNKRVYFYWKSPQRGIEKNYKH